MILLVYQPLDEIDCKKGIYTQIKLNLSMIVIICNCLLESDGVPVLEILDTTTVAASLILRRSQLSMTKTEWNYINWNTSSRHLLNAMYSIKTCT